MQRLRDAPVLETFYEFTPKRVRGVIAMGLWGLGFYIGYRRFTRALVENDVPSGGEELEGVALAIHYTAHVGQEFFIPLAALSCLALLVLGPIEGEEEFIDD